MTRAGRVAAVLAVVAALGFGYDEPVPAAPVEPVTVPARAASTPLDAERAIWRGLDAETRARYCALPRRQAVAEYAGAVAEGPHWRHADRLARAVLRQGCAR